MDHHRTDGGAVAPETAGAGPGDPVRAAGGPTAGAGGRAASARRVRPDGAPGPSGVGGAGSAADRVWAVLLFHPDPIEWHELAQLAEVSRVAALEALLGFENGGFLLHIPAQRHGRFPHGDLWVLAGGVREQQGVSDAVSLGLLAELSAASSDQDGPGQDVWAGVLDLGVVAPTVPIGPVTGLTVLPRGWLKELVLEQLIESYPAELSVVGIAQLLGGRSFGAIRNAAEELCRDGRAVCTDPEVKKYVAFAPDGSPIESPGEHENIA